MPITNPDSFEGATSFSSRPVGVPVNRGQGQILSPDPNIKAVPEGYRDSKYLRGTYYFGDDLNEIKAQSQNAFDKFGNDLVKLGALTGTTFAETFTDLFVGIPTAISRGEFSGVYDNAASDMFKRWNENLEKQFPNYYTKEELAKPFYENMFGKGWSNFWFDKFLKNVGFTAGAILAGMATAGMGAALIGTSRSAKIAKLALEGGKLAAGERDAMVVAEGLKGIESWKDLSKAASIIRFKNLFNNTQALAAATTTEAGIEAHQGINDYIKATVQDYKDKHGYEPSIEEFDKIRNDATSLGNVRFALNFPVLLVSNVVQFGRMFSKSFGNDVMTLTKVMEKSPEKLATIIDSKTGKAFSELSTAERLTAIANKTFVNKGVSNLEKTWRIIQKPISEGLWEEQMQFAIEKGTKDYYTTKYNHKGRADINDITNSMAKGLGAAYGTAEGWEQGVIGAITGMISLPGSHVVKEEGSDKPVRKITAMGGIWEGIQESRSKNERTDKAVALLNRDGFFDMYKNLLDNVVAHKNYTTEWKESVERGDAFTAQNSKLAELVSLADMHVSNGTFDVFMDMLDSVKDADAESFKQNVGYDINKDVTKEQISSSIEAIKNTAKKVKSLKEDIDVRFPTLDPGLRHMLVYSGAVLFNTADRITDLSNEIHNLSKGLVAIPYEEVINKSGRIITKTKIRKDHKAKAQDLAYLLNIPEADRTNDQKNIIVRSAKFLKISQEGLAELEAQSSKRDRGIMLKDAIKKANAPSLVYGKKDKKTGIRNFGIIDSSMKMNVIASLITNPNTKIPKELKDDTLLTSFAEQLRQSNIDPNNLDKIANLVHDIIRLKEMRDYFTIMYDRLSKGTNDEAAKRIIDVIHNTITSETLKANRTQVVKTEQEPEVANEVVETKVEPEKKAEVVNKESSEDDTITTGVPLGDTSSNYRGVLTLPVIEAETSIQSSYTAIKAGRFTSEILANINKTLAAQKINTDVFTPEDQAIRAKLEAINNEVKLLVTKLGDVSINDDHHNAFDIVSDIKTFLSRPANVEIIKNNHIEQDILKVAQLGLINGLRNIKTYIPLVEESDGIVDEDYVKTLSASNDPLINDQDNNEDENDVSPINKSSLGIVTATLLAYRHREDDFKGTDGVFRYNKEITNRINNPYKWIADINTLRTGTKLKLVLETEEGYNSYKTDDMMAWEIVSNDPDLVPIKIVKVNDTVNDPAVGYLHDIDWVKEFTHEEFRAENIAYIRDIRKQLITNNKIKEEPIITVKNRRDGKLFIDADKEFKIARKVIRNNKIEVGIMVSGRIVIGKDRYLDEVDEDDIIDVVGKPISGIAYLIVPVGVHKATSGRVSIHKKAFPLVNAKLGEIDAADTYIMSIVKAAELFIKDGKVEGTDINTVNSLIQYIKTIIHIPYTKGSLKDFLLTKPFNRVYFKVSNKFIEFGTGGLADYGRYDFDAKKAYIREEGKDKEVSLTKFLDEMTLLLREFPLTFDKDKLNTEPYKPVLYVNGSFEHSKTIIHPKSYTTYILGRTKTTLREIEYAEHQYAYAIQPMIELDFSNLYKNEDELKQSEELNRRGADESKRNSIETSRKGKSRTAKKVSEVSDKAKAFAATNNISEELASSVLKAATKWNMSPEDALKKYNDITSHNLGASADTPFNSLDHNMIDMIDTLSDYNEFKKYFNDPNLYENLTDEGRRAFLEGLAKGDFVITCK
jgi:hypothetical protein